MGGHSENPPVTVDKCLGEIVLMEGTLKEGDEFEFVCGTKRTKCRVERIVERISSETGEVMGRSTGEIGKNEAATLVFQTEPVVIELFSEIPELGRFILARTVKMWGPE